MYSPTSWWVVAGGWWQSLGNRLLKAPVTYVCWQVNDSLTLEKDVYSLTGWQRPLWDCFGWSEIGTVIQSPQKKLQTCQHVEKHWAVTFKVVVKLWKVRHKIDAENFSHQNKSHALWKMLATMLRHNFYSEEKFSILSACVPLFQVA